MTEGSPLPTTDANVGSKKTASSAFGSSSDNGDRARRARRELLEQARLRQARQLAQYRIAQAPNTSEAQITAQTIARDHLDRATSRLTFPSFDRILEELLLTVPAFAALPRGQVRAMLQNAMLFQRRQMQDRESAADPSSQHHAGLNEVTEHSSPAPAATPAATTALPTMSPAIFEQLHLTNILAIAHADPNRRVLVDQIRQQVPALANMASAGIKFLVEGAMRIRSLRDPSTQGFELGVTEDS